MLLLRTSVDVQRPGLTSVIVTGGVDDDDDPLSNLATSSRTKRTSMSLLVAYLLRGFVDPQSALCSEEGVARLDLSE